MIGIKTLGFGLGNFSKNKWNYRHQMCNSLEIPVLCPVHFLLSSSLLFPSFLASPSSPLSFSHTYSHSAVSIVDNEDDVWKCGD